MKFRNRRNVLILLYRIPEPSPPLRDAREPRGKTARGVHRRARRGTNSGALARTFRRVPIVTRSRSRSESSRGCSARRASEVGLGRALQVGRMEWSKSKTTWVRRRVASRSGRDETKGNCEEHPPATWTKIPGYIGVAKTISDWLFLSRLKERKTHSSE